uniref:Uncharacterized protein n=1 Tax=Lepeophtheirus salmonis TaxID=72036 RepID=A0A0K2T1Q1_LEPSM
MLKGSLYLIRWISSPLMEGSYDA